MSNCPFGMKMRSQQQSLDPLLNLQLSTNGSWRPQSCESSHRFVCQYQESIITPVEGNRLEGFSSRTERQRNFDTLSPNAHHKDICGRRFVRQKRIVGGGIADYGEWPWQVSGWGTPY